MPLIDLTNRKSSEELKKLPSPTNLELGKLFLGIDKVVIKQGGVYKGKAMTDKIVLSITQFDNIQKLKELLQIDEAVSGFYCMCSGDYAIELYEQNSKRETIGFHHGVSIRYDRWNSDAQLSKSDLLLSFLADQGLRKPLQDRIATKRNMEADRVFLRKWLNASPKCFKKYLQETNSENTDYLKALLFDLELEIPYKRDQIIALLQSFGLTENPWTNYPVYEELPRIILNRFEVREIILAYQDSDRNYKTRRGLGRFLCSFEPKTVLAECLKDIPLIVIEELQKCFTYLEDFTGVERLAILSRDKNNS